MSGAGIITKNLVLPGKRPVEFKGGGIKGAPESRLWLRSRPMEASVLVGDSFSDMKAIKEDSSPGRVTVKSE